MVIVYCLACNFVGRCAGVGWCLMALWVMVDFVVLFEVGCF